MVSVARPQEAHVAFCRAPKRSPAEPPGRVVGTRCSNLEVSTRSSPARYIL